MRFLRNSIFVLLILAVLGAGGWYFVEQREVLSNLQLTNAQEQANTKVAALEQELERAIEPPTVVTNMIDTDVTNWKTYTDTVSQSSFRYPSSWTVIPMANTNLLTIIPTRYKSIYENDLKLIGKATPVPLYVGCGVSTESVAATIASLQASAKTNTTESGRPLYHNFQTLTLRSGVVSSFYQWEALYSTSQHFLTEKNGYRCDWAIMMSTESPLTKDEDGVAWKILNTFTYLK